MRNWITLAERLHPSLIDEVAPYDEMRGTKYYHGTPTTAAAKSIIASGQINPGHEKQGRGLLAPVAGRAYLTSDLEYAAIYALGGVFMGHNYPEKYYADEP